MAYTCLSAAAVLTLFASLSFAQVQPTPPAGQQPTQASRAISSAKERTELIRKAEKAYSSLGTQGLNGFRCRVQPDFDAMFKSLKTDEAGKTEVLPIMKKIRFQVVAGPDGGASVSHQNDEAPPSQAIAERISKVTGGTDQMIDGFLRTWTNMAISSPFAGVDTNETIEDLGQKYRLKHKDASADVTLLIGHDFTIEEMDVVLSGQHVILHPVWAATPRGWRLDSYDGTFEAESGTTTSLTVKFTYQDIEGFQMLNIVDVTMSLPSGTVDGTLHVPFVFSDYQITKR
jgi:hypothetical protein